MWDGVAQGLVENKKQAGCVLCSWRDSHCPHRGSSVSEAMEEKSNLDMDRKHWRTPCSCSMNCESGKWQALRRKREGRTSSMRWGFISWVIGSHGPCQHRKWSDSSVEAGLRPGPGGRCQFPDEMWVRVSTKMQAFTQSVDTHTEFSNWKFWCIL